MQRILDYIIDPMTVFLKHIFLSAPTQKKSYPLNIPAYQQGLDIHIDTPFLILSGENGCGKSTLLEAIADQCGFNICGGSHDHYYRAEHASSLAQHLTLAWLPKIRRGFYLRAENLSYFSDYLDDLADDDPGILSDHEGKSLKKRSHGEAFFELFRKKFRDGIFLLDEPETALSPKRQLEFVALVRELARGSKAQFIIATHSPMIMSIPEAQVVTMCERGVKKVSYRDTEHFQLSRLFLESPERFYGKWNT